MEQSLADGSGQLQNYLNNVKVERAKKWDNDNFGRDSRPKVNHFLKAGEEYGCYVDMGVKHTLPDNEVIQVSNQDINTVKQAQKLNRCCLS